MVFGILPMVFRCVLKTKTKGFPMGFGMIPMGCPMGFAKIPFGFPMGLCKNPIVFRWVWSNSEGFSVGFGTNPKSFP